jgi:hypothetical protein
MMRAASSRWRLTGTFSSGSGGGNETRLPGQGLGTFSSFERQSRQVHAVTKDHRMTNAPESLQTFTRSASVPDPAIPRETILSHPPSTVCELALGNAFFPTINTPPVSVLSVFGADQLHQCRSEGSCDLPRAIKENTDCLVRSYRNLHSNKDSNEWEDLIFRFGHRAFLCVDENRVVGYAGTCFEAERLVREFIKNYAKPKVASGGSFYLIKQGQNDISTETVSLSSDTILGQEALDLHYGGEIVEWHKDFSKKLLTRNYGLSIFEGLPGTGKTFYLRHLMGVLRESHRFYFIPTSTMDILSRQDFIGFWAGQRRIHADRKFVVILEDSDAALMTRGSDNREQVSAILNLSDGMLADFLRLQIICTINCSAADIDPALLRPGRMLCHRVFGRLDYAQAARLAESLGRKLPAARDYSLAEVFAGHDADEINRPRIGFAA